MPAGGANEPAPSFGETDCIGGKDCRQYSFNPFLRHVDPLRTDLFFDTTHSLFTATDPLTSSDIFEPYGGWMLVHSDAHEAAGL